MSNLINSARTLNRENTKLIEESVRIRKQRGYVGAVRHHWRPGDSPCLCRRRACTLNRPWVPTRSQLDVAKDKLKENFAGQVKKWFLRQHSDGMHELPSTTPEALCPWGFGSV